MYSELIDELHQTISAHDFARTAKLILKLNQSDEWRKEGPFHNWSDYVRRGFRVRGLSRASVWVHLRVARLLSRHLSNPDLNEIGIEKCRELCLLARRGSLDANWIALAKTVSVRRLRLAVREDIKRKHGPTECGPRIDGPVECGPHFNPPFRGLLWGPTNEQGVVFLFALVAEDLHFKVESIQRGYPDCIAMQRISTNPERWVRKRIEFEYASSNFSHPWSGANLIVCWEDDLKEKARIPVLELRTEIRKLGANKITKT